MSRCGPIMVFPALFTAAHVGGIVSHQRRRIYGRTPTGFAFVQTEAQDGL